MFSEAIYNCVDSEAQYNCVDYICINNSNIYLSRNAKAFKSKRWKSTLPSRNLLSFYCTFFSLGWCISFLLTALVMASVDTQMIAVTANIMITNIAKT